MATGAMLIGGGAVRARISREAQAFPGKVAKAIHRRAEIIMGRSKNEFVPVDLGNLKNDGRVGSPEIEGTTISVTMGYGEGAAASYALAVHEHLSPSSPPSWQIAEAQGHPVTFTIGGPKYLELPLMQASGTLAADIASDIKFGV